MPIMALGLQLRPLSAISSDVYLEDIYSTKSEEKGELNIEKNFVGVISTFYRFRTILLSSPLNICGFLLSAFANNFEIMVTGRILVGVGCGIAMPAVPVYVSAQFFL